MAASIRKVVQATSSVPKCSFNPNRTVSHRQGTFVPKWNWQKVTRGLIFTTSALGTGLIAKKYYNTKHSLRAAETVRAQPVLSDLHKPITPWHHSNPVTKQVHHDNNPSDLKLTLYQYVTCPFCCKVRAYLDFYGVDYDVVEVDSITRKQKKWTTYRKVPILTVDSSNRSSQSNMSVNQINDSSVIVSLLHSYHATLEKKNVDQLLNYYPAIESVTGKKKVVEYPNKYFIMYGDETPEKSFAELREEREWREWVDDNLVHVLSPNAYRTLPEAVQSFRWFSKVGEWESVMTTWSRHTCIYLGATVMWAIGGRLRRRHGLDRDVRLSLYTSINQWLDGIGPSRTFMGGQKPNLADLAVYGVLCSIEGCQAFTDAVENTKLMRWYGPMKEAVKSHAGRPTLEKIHQSSYQATN